MYPLNSVSNAIIIKQQPVSQVVDTIKSSKTSSILNKIVYIQYSSKINIKEAEEIRNKFKNNEWAAPRIDRVKGNFNNIIKYFHPEDEGIAAEANKVLDDKFKVISSISAKYQKLVPKGQIEVWVSY